MDCTSLPFISVNLRDIIDSVDRIPIREAVRIFELNFPCHPKFDDNDSECESMMTQFFSSVFDDTGGGPSNPELAKVRSESVQNNPEQAQRRRLSDGSQSLPNIDEHRGKTRQSLSTLCGAWDPDVILSALENDQGLECVHLTPTLPSTHPNYCPYLMHVVLPDQIDFLNYCVVTRDKAVRYIKGYHPSTQTIDRWKYEQQLYHRLSSLSFFKNFKKQKAFNGLGAVVGMSPMSKMRRKLRSSLLTCDSGLSDTLVLARTMCLDMADFALTHIDWELTYSLSEFMEEQVAWLREKSSRLFRYHSILLQLCMSTCWDDVITAGLAELVDTSIQSQSVRIGEIRKKNRQKRSQEDGSLSQAVASEADKGQWKNEIRDNDEKMREKRERCEKLGRFIFLVDCLVTQSLHTVYLNSLQRIEELLSAQTPTFPTARGIRQLVKSYYIPLDKQKEMGKYSDEESDDSSDDNSDEDDDDDFYDDDHHPYKKYDSNNESDNDEDDRKKKKKKKKKDDIKSKKQNRKGKGVGKKTKNNDNDMYEQDTSASSSETTIVSQKQNEKSRKKHKEDSPRDLASKSSKGLPRTHSIENVPPQLSKQLSTVNFSRSPTRSLTVASDLTSSKSAAATYVVQSGLNSSVADMTAASTFTTSSTSSSFSDLDYLSANNLFFGNLSLFNNATFGEDGDFPLFQPLDNIFHSPEVERDNDNEYNGEGATVSAQNADEVEIQHDVFAQDPAVGNNNNDSTDQTPTTEKLIKGNRSLSSIFDSTSFTSNSKVNQTLHKYNSLVSDPSKQRDLTKEEDLGSSMDTPTYKNRITARKIAAVCRDFFQPYGSKRSTNFSTQSARSSTKIAHSLINASPSSSSTSVSFTTTSSKLSPQLQSFSLSDFTLRLRSQPTTASKLLKNQRTQLSPKPPSPSKVKSLSIPRSESESPDGFVKTNSLIFDRENTLKQFVEDFPSSKMSTTSLLITSTATRPNFKHSPSNTDVEEDTSLSCISHDTYNLDKKSRSSSKIQASHIFETSDNAMMDDKNVTYLTTDNFEKVKPNPEINIIDTTIRKIGQSIDEPKKILKSTSSIEMFENTKQNHVHVRDRGMDISTSSPSRKLIKTQIKNLPSPTECTISVTTDKAVIGGHDDSAMRNNLKLFADEPIKMVIGAAKMNVVESNIANLLNPFQKVNRQVVETDSIEQANLSRDEVHISNIVSSNASNLISKPSNPKLGSNTVPKENCFSNTTKSSLQDLKEHSRISSAATLTSTRIKEDDKIKIHPTSSHTTLPWSIQPPYLSNPKSKNSSELVAGNIDQRSSSNNDIAFLDHISHKVNIFGVKEAVAEKHILSPKSPAKYEKSKSPSNSRRTTPVHNQEDVPVLNFYEKEPPHSNSSISTSIDVSSLSDVTFSLAPSPSLKSTDHISTLDIITDTAQLEHSQHSCSFSMISSSPENMVNPFTNTVCTEAIIEAPSSVHVRNSSSISSNTLQWSTLTIEPKVNEINNSDKNVSLLFSDDKNANLQNTDIRPTGIFHKALDPFKTFTKTRVDNFPLSQNKLSESSTNAPKGNNKGLLKTGEFSKPANGNQKHVKFQLDKDTTSSSILMRDKNEVNIGSLLTKKDSRLPLASRSQPRAVLHSKKMCYEFEKGNTSNNDWAFDDGEDDKRKIVISPRNLHACKEGEDYYDDDADIVIINEPTNDYDDDADVIIYNQSYNAVVNSQSSVSLGETETSISSSCSSEGFSDSGVDAWLMDLVNSVPRYIRYKLYPFLYTNSGMSEYSECINRITHKNQLATRYLRLRHSRSLNDIKNNYNVSSELYSHQINVSPSNEGCDKSISPDGSYSTNVKRNLNDNQQCFADTCPNKNGSVSCLDESKPHGLLKLRDERPLDLMLTLATVDNSKKILESMVLRSGGEINVNWKCADGAPLEKLLNVTYDGKGSLGTCFTINDLTCGLSGRSNNEDQSKSLSYSSITSSKQNILEKQDVACQCCSKPSLNNDVGNNIEYSLKPSRSSLSVDSRSIEPKTVTNKVKMNSIDSIKNYHPSTTGESGNGVNKHDFPPESTKICQGNKNEILITLCNPQCNPCSYENEIVLPIGTKINQQKICCSCVSFVCNGSNLGGDKSSAKMNSNFVESMPQQPSKESIEDTQLEARECVSRQSSLIENFDWPFTFSDSSKRKSPPKTIHVSAKHRLVRKSESVKSSSSSIIDVSATHKFKGKLSPEDGEQDIVLNRITSFHSQSNDDPLPENVSISSKESESRDIEQTLEEASELLRLNLNGDEGKNTSVTIFEGPCENIEPGERYWESQSDNKKHSMTERPSGDKENRNSHKSITTYNKKTSGMFCRDEKSSERKIGETKRTSCAGKFHNKLKPVKQDAGSENVNEKSRCPCLEFQLQASNKGSTGTLETKRAGMSHDKERFISPCNKYDTMALIKQPWHTLHVPKTRNKGVKKSLLVCDDALSMKEASSPTRRTKSALTSKLSRSRYLEDLERKCHQRSQYSPRRRPSYLGRSWDKSKYLGSDVGYKRFDCNSRKYDRRILKKAIEDDDAQNANDKGIPGALLCFEYLSEANYLEENEYVDGMIRIHSRPEEKLNLSKIKSERNRIKGESLDKKEEESISMSESETTCYSPPKSISKCEHVLFCDKNIQCDGHDRISKHDGDDAVDRNLTEITTTVGEREDFSDDDNLSSLSSFGMDDEEFINGKYSCVNSNNEMDDDISNNKTNNPVVENRNINDESVNVKDGNFNKEENKSSMQYSRYNFDMGLNRFQPSSSNDNHRETVSVNTSDEKDDISVRLPGRNIKDNEDVEDSDSEVNDKTFSIELQGDEPNENCTCCEENHEGYDNSDDIGDQNVAVDDLDSEINDKTAGIRRYGDTFNDPSYNGSIENISYLGKINYEEVYFDNVINCEIIPPGLRVESSDKINSTINEVNVSDTYDVKIDEISNTDTDAVVMNYDETVSTALPVYDNDEDDDSMEYVAHGIKNNDKTVNRGAQNETYNDILNNIVEIDIDENDSVNQVSIINDFGETPSQVESIHFLSNIVSFDNDVRKDISITNNENINVSLSSRNINLTPFQGHLDFQEIQNDENQDVILLFKNVKDISIVNKQIAAGRDKEFFKGKFNQKRVFQLNENCEDVFLVTSNDLSGNNEDCEQEPNSHTSSIGKTYTKESSGNQDKTPRKTAGSGSGGGLGSGSAGGGGVIGYGSGSGSKDGKDGGKGGSKGKVKEGGGAGGGGGGSGNTIEEQPDKSLPKPMKPAFHISLIHESETTYLSPDVYDFVAMVYSVTQDTERTLRSFHPIIRSTPFLAFMGNQEDTTISDSAIFSAKHTKPKGTSLENRIANDINIVNLKNSIYDQIEVMFQLMGLFTKKMDGLYRRFFQDKPDTDVHQIKDIRTFVKALQRHDKQVKILERLPESQRLGMFLLDMSVYRDCMRQRSANQIARVRKELNQEINGRIHLLMMRILDVKDVLESEPFVTDCQFRLLTFIDHGDFLMDELEKYEIPFIAGLYETIDQFGVPYDTATRGEFESSHAIMDSVRKLRDRLHKSKRHELSKDLETSLARDEAWIKSQVSNAIYPLTRDPKLYNGKSKWTDVEFALGTAEMQTVELVAKANFVRRIQHYLKKPVSDFNKVFRAATEYCNVRNAWLLLKDWESKVAEWKETHFTKLDVAKLNVSVFQYMEACRKLAPKLPRNTVTQFLEDGMDLMLRWLNFIIEFRSSVIKPRHWSQIQDILGVEFGVNLPLTLGSLMSINALEKHKILHSVLNRARVENNVQNDYDEIIRQFHNLTLPIQAKDRTIIPGESSVRIYQLSDSFELEESLNYLLMEMERIDMSPQSAFLHADIERQVHNIFAVLEILVLWTELTMKLARMRRVFMRNQYLVESHPAYVSQYKSMYTQSSELLGKARSNPIAHEWCQSEAVSNFLGNTHDDATLLLHNLRQVQEAHRAQNNDTDDPRSEDTSIGPWNVPD